jgi:hypothetical protein
MTERLKEPFLHPHTHAHPTHVCVYIYIYIYTRTHTKNKQVKKPGNSTLFKAEVLGRSDYSDLALLRVPDEGFWEGVDVSKRVRACVRVLCCGVVGG